MSFKRLPTSKFVILLPIRFSFSEESDVNARISEQIFDSPSFPN